MAISTTGNDGGKQVETHRQKALKCHDLILKSDAEERTSDFSGWKHHRLET